VYSRKGDLENALLQLQRALEIQTRVFGSEHPDVAASCNNIGDVYEQKGDLENALLQQQKRSRCSLPCTARSRKRGHLVLVLVLRTFDRERKHRDSRT